MAMNEQEGKYLRLARQAREENNVEDAKKFYDLVRTENPDNAEAKFFYLIYRCWDGTKGEWKSNYNSFLNGAVSAVKGVARMEMPDAEKGKILSEMLSEAIATYEGARKVETDLGRAGGNSAVVHNDKPTILMLYQFGDAIEETMPTNTSAMDAACAAWKKAVALNQIYYAGIDKSLPEKYEAKIQKLDSSYVKPKKGGCIRLG